MSMKIHPKRLQLLSGRVLLQPKRCPQDEGHANFPDENLQTGQSRYEDKVTGAHFRYEEVCAKLLDLYDQREDPENFSQAIDEWKMQVNSRESQLNGSTADERPEPVPHFDPASDLDDSGSCGLARDQPEIRLGNALLSTQGFVQSRNTLMRFQEITQGLRVNTNMQHTLIRKPGAKRSSKLKLLALRMEQHKETKDDRRSLNENYGLLSERSYMSNNPSNNGKLAFQFQKMASQLRRGTRRLIFKNDFEEKPRILSCEQMVKRDKKSTDNVLMSDKGHILIKTQDLPSKKKYSEYFPKSRAEKLLPVLDKNNYYITSSCSDLIIMQETKQKYMTNLSRKLLLSKKNSHQQTAVIYPLMYPQ